MYNREGAVAYAHEWAYGRNPKYYSFNGIGGDCTNFVSQCLLAGGAPMNFTETFGWYYKSANNRAAAWSGVQYLYNFLTGRHTVGPHGEEIELGAVIPGDIIQLAFSPDHYGHTLIVVGRGPFAAPDNVLIATHTDDSDYRPLSTYNFYSYRCLRITVPD